MKFTILLLLTCAASSHLSCVSAVTLSRRHLLDDDVADLPPPLFPPSPPFFPLDSSTPPPPPPPTFAVFPTFPANISALVLPRSPKPHSTSPTLLISAISAVLAVATAIGFFLFLYGRRQGQNRHFKSGDDEEEQRHTTTTTNNSNFSVAATTSPSEVFYLSPQESDRVRTGGPCFLKPESPEIRPLPPLPPRSFHQNHEVEENQNDDEEEDEFFSPMASLPGSENSSPSREGSYSTSSSSSGWVSPARSFSITVSPPQIWSPGFSDRKLESPSNPIYYWNQKLESPSPERRQVRNWSSSSLRMFSFWNQNLGFPRISSASTSPERGRRTPLSSLHSSVTNSPDGFLRKFLDSSPPIWNDFSRNVKSVLLSSDTASSRRDFVINIAESAPHPPTRPPPLVPPSRPTTQLHSQKTTWDCLKASSFKFNKELVETLFIANSSSPNMKRKALNYDQEDHFDALLYTTNFHSEGERLRRSFCILQGACEELRTSRTVSSLFESILKTGDKMYVGTNAYALKLDKLIKVMEAKGSSLLRAVAQDMMKSEGLKGVRELNSELVNVKKSAEIDYGLLRRDVAKFYQGIQNIEELLLLSEKRGSSGDQWLKFKEKMSKFLGTAAAEILTVKTEESLMLTALEEVAEQFLGDSGQTLRIFKIVNDFMCVLDKVCMEMGECVPA